MTSRLSTLPPSARLPQIRRIFEQSLDELARLVEYLYAIYNPPVYGARRITRQRAGGIVSGHSSKDADADAAEVLRADDFERAYAVRWLTALLVHLTDEPPQESLPTETATATDALIRAASELVAICAGTAAARTLTRLFVFTSGEGEIAVRLTDVPIAVDEGTPLVGAQTWGSAPLLAEMLVEDPAKFGLATLNLNSKQRKIRVLELGAGTGLVSLALTKLLSLPSPARQPHPSAATVTVVASDYHPDVLRNLRQNVAANFPTGTPAHVELDVRTLDWSEYSAPSVALGEKEVAEEERFDVVLGADVIYEPAHAVWIRDCVSALLRRPAEGDEVGEREMGPSPRFHLVMPLRATHAFESRAVEEAFPPRGHTSAVAASPTLCVLEKETIACEGEKGRGAEVEYVHFVIGWA